MRRSPKEKRGSGFEGRYQVKDDRMDNMQKEAQMVRGEKIRRLLEANNEELERRRKAEELVDEGRILLEGALLIVRRLEKRSDRKFVIGFMAGFGVAYLILEGLRWLFS